jgi:hypothetical protein
VASRNADTNFLRKKVLLDFRAECLTGKEYFNVAIVGGSLNDNEVALVRERHPEALFETYGIEECQIFMDLNMNSLSLKEFDLVLCTNVIEHIFHHENFAKNLISLLNHDGILWCCFPYNDMYHGAPDYYSAGFDPEYVVRLFERNGGVAEKSKVISSRRGYLFTHLLKDWPSEFRYNHPLVGQILWSLGLRGNSRPPIKNISLHRLLVCLYLSLIPKSFTSDQNYGCSGWVKIRKK